GMNERAHSFIIYRSENQFFPHHPKYQSYREDDDEDNISGKLRNLFHSLTNMTGVHRSRSKCNRMDMIYPVNRRWCPELDRKE
ncbi:hypothetical protein PFISCL1PPCAC_27827, partial [Pristionchus fissidentatus]